MIEQTTVAFDWMFDSTDVDSNNAFDATTMESNTMSVSTVRAVGRWVVAATPDPWTTDPKAIEDPAASGNESWPEPSVVCCRRV